MTMLLRLHCLVRSYTCLQITSHTTIVAVDEYLLGSHQVTPPCTSIQAKQCSPWKHFIPHFTSTCQCAMQEFHFFDFQWKVWFLSTMLFGLVVPRQRALLTTSSSSLRSKTNLQKLIDCMYPFNLEAGAPESLSLQRNEYMSFSRIGNAGHQWSSR